MRVLALALLLAAAQMPPRPAVAQPSDPAASGAAAPVPQAVRGNVLELADDVPDRHVVVRGDTLWGISGRFLKQPWRWPDIWQLNREQIRNPHLIYPGDVVYLDRSGPSPRLRLGKPVGAGLTTDPSATVKLYPQVRSEANREAIPSIPAAAIEPFLSRPLVVEPAELQRAARIIATQEGRVYLGRGDKAYVRGLPDDARPGMEFHLYRPARPLLDPDTRRPIAYESTFLGSAVLRRLGDPATIEIKTVTQEVGDGDRLMLAEPPRIVSYAPRAPDSEIRGRVISIYGGVRQAGRNMVVALNIGTDSGLEVGHVLAVDQIGRVVRDREASQNDPRWFKRDSFVRLPDEHIGLLFVFRTFGSIAYGLVMNSSEPVEVGDVVVNP